MTGRARRTPLWSPRLALFLLASLCIMSGFYLLMSVVPLYTNDSGAGSGTAGLVTGIMMLATVLIELITPAGISRLGYRIMLAIGALALGLPSLLLPLTDTPVAILAISAVRGAGLAIAVVAGTALAAQLAPPDRRGEALGLYGLVINAPGVYGLPAGVWLAEHGGFTTVFVLAAVLPLTALPMLISVPGRGDPVEAHSRFTGLLKVPSLRRLGIVFASVTIAFGVATTFLPIAAHGDAVGWVTAALFAQTLTAALARWVCGRIGDTHGSARLLLPSLVLAGTGAAALIATGTGWALVAGMALFGTGLGMAQNVTLTLMLDSAPKHRFGQISALWNIAYDGGMGVGAGGFGYLALATGFGWGFAVVAGLLFAALLPAIRDLPSHR